MNKSTSLSITLNKQSNQDTNGFPSSPRVCKITPQTTENVRMPKIFAELYFSWPSYSEIAFSPLITWILSLDIPHGLIISVFRNDDIFLADDFTPAVVLFTNLYSVSMILCFVPV